MYIDYTQTNMKEHWKHHVRTISEKTLDGLHVGIIRMVNDGFEKYYRTLRTVISRILERGHITSLPTDFYRRRSYMKVSV